MSLRCFATYFTIIWSLIVLLLTDCPLQAKANGATVVAFLQRLAPLYNELYAAAKAAMVPLPKEALASIVRPAPTAFKYDPLRFGGAAGDWETFTDEGFVIAATIPPDPRLASLTSPALAAAEAEVAEGKAGDAATDDPVEGEGDGVQEDAAGEADSIAPVADENGGEEEKAEGVVEGNGGETAAAAEPEGDAAALPIPAEDTADPPAAADASVEDQKDVAEVVEGPEAAEEVADGKLQEEAPQVEVVVTPEVAPEPEDPLAALVLEAAKTRVLKPAAP